MTRFDAVIAGGGAAGSTLAIALAAVGWRVALVDDGAAAASDRDWQWWSTGELMLDGSATRTWSRIRVAGPGWDRRARLAPYGYRSIGGEALAAAVERAGVARLAGAVHGVATGRDGPSALVRGPDGEVAVAARVIFDGTGTGAGPAPRLPRLDFSGWHVESAVDAFEPDTVTLMDFRTDQSDGVAFLYVLPTSRRRALVERTVVASPSVAEVDHAPYLDAYLTDELGLIGFRVVARESGSIPLRLDPPRPRRGAIPIGVRAGMVRASTGYGMARMQRHAEAIAAAVAQGRDPRRAGPPRRGRRALDAQLLRLAARDPAAALRVLEALFLRNAPADVLGFLEERLSPWAQARVMASLPFWHFVRADADAVRARLVGARVRRRPARA